MGWNKKIFWSLNETTVTFGRKKINLCSDSNFAWLENLDVFITDFVQNRFDCVPEIASLFVNNFAVDFVEFAGLHFGYKVIGTGIILQTRYELFV